MVRTHCDGFVICDKCRNTFKALLFSITTLIDMLHLGGTKAHISDACAAGYHAELQLMIGRAFLGQF